ncbi:MAG TPA: VOC family protein [Bryobacteraceae bacterium]|jgi:PhnB protein
MSIQGSRPPHDRSIAPNLMVRGVDAAISFYQQALGAEVVYRGTMPNGVTLHAQLRIAGSYFFLSDESMSHGGLPTGSPQKLGAVTAILDLFVDDVDSSFDRAVRAGGKPLGPVEDAFYGDRVGMFQDPFGHIWSLATTKEVLTSEEIYRRMLEHFSPVS